VDELVAQAQDEARRHGWGGRPMAAVSVFCAVEGWTVETILRDILDTRSTYATAPLGRFRAAGFEVLPSHNSPHFDVALPEATSEAASTMLMLFTAAQRNPYRRRR
jgi:hypothetical protein